MKRLIWLLALLPSLANGQTLYTTACYLSGSSTACLKPVAIAGGGTSATTKSAAFDALSPMNAQGDIIYGGSGGTGTRLALGIATTVLHGGATLPAYSTIVNADVDSAAAIAGSKLAAAASGVAGAVSTTTQTFTGAKTFETQLIGAGTTSGVDAAAGIIGENLGSNNSSGVAGVSGSYTNIATKTLTAGDWLVSVVAAYEGNSTTVTANSTALDCVLTSVSNSSSTPIAAYPYARAILYHESAHTTTSGMYKYISIPGMHIDLSGSQQYWLNCNTTFSATAPNLYGNIEAYRIR